MELSPPDPRIGQVLQGRYRILARLAAGAMGVVYKGERVELNRPVAVKFLHPWVAAQQAFRTRFETEARAMSRLSHPNCVSVIDFGVEGSPYLVMDYVTGSTLRQVLDGGRLAPARAIAIVRQLLAGAAHAHAQGIIHRDLKPENLILSDTAGLADHVRILDFGLAKLRDGPAMTAGLAIGTPSYMSPEQTGAPGEIDGRTDIYAIGVVLFEALAGRKPFVSDKVAEILLMHRESPVPSLREVARGVAISPELEAVAMRALAKSPEERFQTAGDFVAALDRVPEAAGARAPGDFRPADAPASPVAAPAAAAPAEADKTIADPPRDFAEIPGAAVGAPAGGGSAKVIVAAGEIDGTPRAPAADAGDPQALRRWLGLGGLAAVALSLVLVGLFRHEGPRAPGTAASGAAGAPAPAPAGVPREPGMEIGPPPPAPLGAPAASPPAAAAVTPPAKTAPPPPPAAPTPSPAARLADADRLIKTGEWEQAQVVLEKAHREEPDNALASYRLANLCLEHKRWAEGAQAARAAGQHDPRYRSDEVLVTNLIRSLANDKGYEKTEDVLHGFGAGPVPLLKTAAAHDKNPIVRQRAAELLRSREGASRGPSRGPSRPPPPPPRRSSQSSHSLFSR